MLDRDPDQIRGAGKAELVLDNGCNCSPPVPVTEAERFCDPQQGW